MRKALLFADLLAFCDFVRTRESLLDPMRAEVRLGEGRLTVRLDGKTHELAIRGQSREPTLLALIRPVPWTREPETRGHLLFRLRHGRLMAPLVTASLRPPLHWRDVYEATSFEIELGEERLARQVASEERFTVPLELVPRSHPGDPELWLLNEDERERLESLLGAVDEEDLASLALAAHVASRSTTRARPRPRSSTRPTIRWAA